MGRLEPAALSTPEMIILPASGIAKGDSFWKHPVSAGRFKLDTLDTTNGKFTLSANPNYYDTAPRKVKKVNFVITDPVAGDKRVRQAISLAVNRQQIAASALGGERVGRPLYGIPWNQDNDSPNAKATKRDIIAAKEKLKGTKCENGCSVPLVTVTDSAWQVPLVAQVVQQQLKAIGIRLEIENTTFTQVGDRLKQGDWGLFTRWIGYYENTRTYLGGYIYGDPTSGNNANFWGTLPTTPDMPGLKALSDRLKTVSSSAAPGQRDRRKFLRIRVHHRSVGQPGVVLRHQRDAARSAHADHAASARPRRRFARPGGDLPSLRHHRGDGTGAHRRGRSHRAGPLPAGTPVHPTLVSANPWLAPNAAPGPDAAGQPGPARWNRPMRSRESNRTDCGDGASSADSAWM
ncbi:ABC transporter substrate-binding protein [Streptomyces sp. NPDC021218]|uniref:ABC transporter substrate-binding protein n=1 Tax=Streptomyces sp. NPDC021218 TaxID=3365119 RepID=UPI0037BCF9E4